MYSGIILGYQMVPFAIALDGSENLYISDLTPNSRVLFIDRTPGSVTLPFANSAVGVPSPDSPRTVTLLNIGSNNLTFTVPATGQNPLLDGTDFSIGAASTCPNPASAASSALSSLASCTYSLNFKPTALGTRSGTLTVTDNAVNPASPKVQTLYLTGTGTTAPTPAQAVLTPATLTFASQVVGTPSAPLTLTLSNPGGSPLTGIAAPSITGAQAADFASTTCGATLAAGATCNFQITFTPSATGAATASFSLVTAAATVKSTLNGSGIAGTASRVVWIPDFQGQALNVEIGTGATAKLVTVALPGTCYPNSVAVQGTNAYVACSLYNGAPDSILIYNATTIHNAPAEPLTLAPTKTITNANFNGLIGLTFDASGNLWIASGGNFNNTGTIEEITAATLNTAAPVVSVAIPNNVNGLKFPTGLAFNTDGSLWVTDNNGILLNFPASQLTKGAAAVPAYCIATTDIEDGGVTCQTQNGIFPSPEGVAVFNGEVWVANNNQGGNGTGPGLSVTGFSFTPAGAGQPGTLAVKETYGTAPAKPFACPGGLFAGSVHLWVNDESFGETNPRCGAAGDVAPNVGGVFAFTPAQLTAASTTATPVYTNLTSRPGFGGIFVENDQ